MPSEPARAEQPFDDYYFVLQVHPEADASMIDAAYWHLARRYNEADDSDPAATTKLDELNEAYSVIGSAARREAYNRERNAALGIDVLPTPPALVPKPTPLAVMDKYRPASREEPKLRSPRRFQFSFRQLSLPPWQGWAGATIAVGLALAAFGVWYQPAIVAVLLVLALTLGAMPLWRGSIRLPALSIPRLRHGRSGGPDAQALQEETRAARDRLRGGGDK